MEKGGNSDMVTLQDYSEEQISVLNQWAQEHGFDTCEVYLAAWILQVYEERTQQKRIADFMAIPGIEQAQMITNYKVTMKNNKEILDKSLDK